MSTTPKLSVIAVFYNMAREAPRTLYSLSADYQRGVSADDYEVIAVDNGSAPPLDSEMVRGFGPNFRHLHMEDAPPSPAAAINRGIAASRGGHVGILIDGARIASPGVLRLALDCLQRFERAVVGTIGFHLGPDSQTRAHLTGYNQQVEDDLLERCDWQTDGYRLFGVSALAGSSPSGWLGRIAESNLLFLPRALFDELDGYDQRFDLPGGGIVNLDFYRRACELPDTTLVTLLGEATFHQIHGGEMTSRKAEEVPARLREYQAQYEAIRGQPYVWSDRQPLLYGYSRPEILPWLQRSATALQAGTKPLAGTPEPGGADHRAHVGPTQHYDRLAALQFGLLALLGLREHHSLLDIGCGSLRGGRLFIPYLLPGRYHGLEPHREMVEAGIERETGRDLIALKQPRFAYNDQFRLDEFGTRFDYTLAQSIFSHTGPTQLRQALAAVAGSLAADGLLVATFVESYVDRYVDEWVYPGLNHYCWATMQAELDRAGLHGVKLDWPHPLQTWFAAARDPARLQAIPRAGVDTLPDDVVLTGPRNAAQRAGGIIGFYRHLRETPPH